MTARIFSLIQKEFVLSFRNIHQVLVVLLYLVGAVFICYKAINNLDPRMWNALFWVLFLFVSISATNISFQTESGSNSLFLYTIYNPIELIISKIIFNFLILMVISMLLVLAMNLFFPIKILRPTMLLATLCLASIGISAGFSLIASISTSEQSNMSLMSIMALPTTLPIFLSGLKLSAHGIGMITDTGISTDFMILGAIDLIILSIVLLLFPYLWKS